MQDNPQGTATWIQARIGHATASRAGTIIRRSVRDGKPLKAYHDYVYELVQERLTNQAADHYTSPAMQHGIDTEAEAALAYQMMTGATLEQSPFVRHPTIEWAGASPDRLVGKDGLLEIKCPTPKTHLESLLGAPLNEDYRWQCIWQMACTGREYNDWMSYDGRFDPHLQTKVERIERKADEIKEAEERFTEFLAIVNERLADIHALGGIDLKQKDEVG
jgi:putative phage-type endonuclease